MSDQARLKPIKIQAGVVKRTAKEKVYYEKDAAKMQEKMDKMRTDGVEEYYIKKQEELRQESLMMIPDCERKCSAAWDELKKLTESESDLAEMEEYKNAIAILDEYKEAAKR